MKLPSSSVLTDRLHVLSSEQEERWTQHRAQNLKLPYISLVAYPINTDDLQLIPVEQATAAQLVMFYRHGKDIRLAAVDPSKPEVATIRQQLAKRFGAEPQLYVISRHSFASALARYRAIHTAVVTPTDELRIAADTTTDTTIANLTQLGERISSVSPTDLITTLLRGAVALGASDIHVEPHEKEARVRYRIDGVLQDVGTFAREGWKLLLSRVKVLAKLKLNVHETPQDGSFVVRLETSTYDIRVSTLPGGTGENIVMRLLNRASEVIRVTDLGMKARDYEVVTHELKRSNGMILVTGPTGSGKTTTLAAFINEVNQPEYKIITLEDPIEYRLPGVEQTQIDAEAGYTFAKGLRSILRQDPDIILVGEVRDAETAETALHAALTGHLVFSTLHTNDAAGAVVRLVDMGIQPFIIAPAVNLVIAQRLVRVVCPKCSKAYKPDNALRHKVADILADVKPTILDPQRLRDPKLTFLQAKGCSECHNTGYRGRKGIFEIFSVEGDLEELVLQGADGNRIGSAAKRQGMTTLLQDAYLKVLDHITTVDEVERVTEA